MYRGHGVPGSRDTYITFTHDANSFETLGLTYMSVHIPHYLDDFIIYQVFSVISKLHS